MSEDFRADLMGGGSETNTPGQAMGEGEGQGQANQGGTGDTGTQDFLNQFSDELRSNPALQNVKDVNDLATQLINAQKMIGGSVKIPGQEGSPEQWGEFWDKAGRPASADKYDVKSNEAITREDAEMSELKAMFHKVGLNNQQAQSLLSEHDAGLMRKMDAQNAAKVAMNEDFLKMAHESFGGPEGWAQKSAQVQQFLTTTVPENIRAEMAGLDNNALLSIVYSIDQAIKAAKEDGPMGAGDSGTSGTGTASPAAIKEQMDAALAETKKLGTRSAAGQAKHKEFQRLNAAYHKALETSQG